MPQILPAFWPPGLPADTHVPATSLNANLQIAALRFPARAVTIFFDSVLTYARASREVDALAGFLQQRCGVRKGDRVALCGQSCPQFLLAYYAILRADAVVVPVNVMSTPDEFRHYVEDSGARVAICAADIFARTRTAVLEHTVVLRYADYLDAPSSTPVPAWLTEHHPVPPAADVHEWTASIAAGLAPLPATAGPHDLCVLPYTSGTTGRPKGCMHTHASMMAAIWTTALWRRLTSETVFLGVAPLFHMLGMQNGMNLPVLLGATVVIAPRWDRDLAAHAIARYRVTAWTAPTAVLVDFFAKPDLDDCDLSSLVLVTGGGGPVPEGTAQTLKTRFDIVVNEAYGLTETAALMLCNPLQRPKMQCLGLPTFGVEARIVDPETLEPLPDGEVGEIALAGRQVMRGYWNNEQGTHDAFIERDGLRFLRTGDLGWRDQDGYFFMTDRLKRMINVSGFKVWPAEVETLMYGHPGIQEACVVGMPDPKQGEAVKAFVRLKAEARGVLDEAEIIAWLRVRLSTYKVPRVVTFVDDFPRASTGKILWRELQ